MDLNHQTYLVITLNKKNSNNIQFHSYPLKLVFINVNVSIPEMQENLRL